MVHREDILINEQEYLALVNKSLRFFICTNTFMIGIENILICITQSKLVSYRRLLSMPLLRSFRP